MPIKSRPCYDEFQHAWSAFLRSGCPAISTVRALADYCATPDAVCPRGLPRTRCVLSDVGKIMLISTYARMLILSPSLLRRIPARVVRFSTKRLPNHIHRSRVSRLLRHPRYADCQRRLAARIRRLCRQRLCDRSSTARISERPSARRTAPRRCTCRRTRLSPSCPFRNRPRFRDR